MFCKHDWDIREKEIPSPYQQMEQSMRDRISKFNSVQLMFQKKMIFHATCLKCGKLKITEHKLF
jgi:hypothetical protein